MNWKLLFFQFIIFWLLFTGYVGLYVCRANITVVTQYIIGKFPNVTKSSFGFMLTLGTISYAIGKFICGFILDANTDKANWIFIASLFGTICSTVAFGFAKSLSMFSLSWIFNRFCQSFAWGCIMVLVGHWWSFGYHSRIVGGLSLSFLFGDAFARAYLGAFIYFKYSWQVVVFISAITLVAFWAPSLFLLYNDPKGVGLDEMESNPDNIYANHDKKSSTLGPIFRNPGFYILCFIAAGFTFIRECLRDWVHIFLVEKAGVSQDLAPIYSALFPVFGGIGSLATGFLMDWFPRGKGLIMGSELILLVIVMIVTTFCNYFMQSIHIALALILVSLMGFSLTGPYALLQVFALDLGGKTATASISSLFDTVGYIFGSTSGIATGYTSQYFGWTGVFVMLTSISLVSTFFCVLFYIVAERSKRSTKIDSEEPAIN